MKLSTTSFSPGQRIPPAFAFGTHDPAQHIQLAPNRNPQLAWSQAPAGTRSFALICVDLDAPTKPDDVNQEGRAVPASLPRAAFYHWVMVDIPTDVTEIAEGACSNGVVARGKQELHGPEGTRQGINDYTGWFAGDKDMSGSYRGYDGPCPPWNDMIAHRYTFTVYALSCERVPVAGTDFTAPQVLEAMQPFILAEASLTGRYAINPAV